MTVESKEESHQNNSSTWPSWSKISSLMARKVAWSDPEKPVPQAAETAVLAIPSAGADNTPRWRVGESLPDAKLGAHEASSLASSAEFKTGTASVKGEGVEKKQLEHPEQHEQAVQTQSAQPAVISAQETVSQVDAKPKKKKTWFMKGVDAVLIGSISLILFNQVSESVKQVYDNHQLKDRISIMEKEQARLIEKGWANPRYIGAFNPLEGEVKGDFTSTRLSVTGFNAGPLAKTMMLKSGVEALSGRNGIVLSRKMAIHPVNPQMSAEEKAYFNWERIVPAIYRHEEAHALFFDQKVILKAPAAWSTIVGQTISNRINAQNGFISWSSPLSETSSWHIRWLNEIRGEALGDAYAVLTKSIDGDAALKQEALNIHMLRSIGWNAASWTSSLDMVGSNHGVDMASFMAGQLPASELVKLNQAEILELAGHIADASMAWAVARQGPLMNFFGPEGEAWWVKLCVQTGLSPEEAKEQWTQWKKSSSSAYPQAAFGGQEWTVGGITWRTKGLPFVQTQSQWRFDGNHGVYAVSQFMDKPRGGLKQVDVERGLIFLDAPGGSDGSKEQLAEAKLIRQIKKSKVNEMIASSKGPLWTQWVMASYLKTDPLKEVERFKSAQGDEQRDHYLIFSTDLIKSFEQEYKVYQKEEKAMGHRILSLQESSAISESMISKEATPENKDQKSKKFLSPFEKIVLQKSGETLPAENIVKAAPKRKFF